MSIRDSKGFQEISHMAQNEGGITGLKLVTDDESVMMSEYIHLHEDRSPTEHRRLYDLITEAMDDEINDHTKYMRMAELAGDFSRPDIALALQIIAREEMNHHEILEALIPGGTNEPLETERAGALLEAAEEQSRYMPEKIQWQKEQREGGEGTSFASHHEIRP